MDFIALIAEPLQERYTTCLEIQEQVSVG